MDSKLLVLFSEFGEDKGRGVKINWDKLDGHIAKVLNTLDFALSNLENTGQVEAAVRQLGVTHIFYGVTPKHIPVSYCKC